ncbi:nitrilotriacetate monooxygenase [Pandoraea terrae]|uniref:Nitrilotriacetate monooxygenase n=1 Tax=Pandoraea terrae TaxID=1537710 RepID=A0A5E4ZDI6_9BURK|nr:flavin reductase [Pandoraea terrae]VVE58350.1 nitrilotriacetate monooxygenase [Pandoraea terrae]
MTAPSAPRHDAPAAPTADPKTDPKAFRSALGAFATGVTVITTRAPDGSFVGLTANSFNSVSLDPPMVLWSLAKKAHSRTAFEAADHWAVHVLAADQEALSNRFAKSGEDKFAGLELDATAQGVPLLRGCVARFHCKTSFQYEGGDHIIFVGEVTAFEREERAPLAFHAGKYALAMQKDPTLPAPRSARLAGSFSEDFLGYQLGRAHFQFYQRIREKTQAAGLTDEQWYVLSTLTVRDGVSAADVDAAISHSLERPSAPVLESLRAGGWLHSEADDAAGQGARFFLTPSGRDRALHLVAASKSLEADALARFGYADGAVLKSLLQKFIASTDPGLPDLWARE